ncbi:MAG: EamA family transporter [Spirochaetia bacterium]|nr:EamA family transporter [Spirochaetia bacterium]
MAPSHVLLTLAIIAIWGTNFVVIKIALGDFPPLFFATLRFAFSALPWLFFVKRPNVSWKWLILYGLCLGGQFGFLFLAMRSSISPGLASLVVQMQVFFTIGLSVLLFRESIKPVVIAGIVLAAAGLALIARNIDAAVTATGIVTVLFAAFSWACSNLVVKKAAAESQVRIDMLGFMVWSCIFAVPPLLILSLLFEGEALDVQAVQGAHFYSWFALAWQVAANTLFGYGAWNWLLARYDAATVTPYALMIPVFGMGASTIVLGESLPVWKIQAALLVMAGVGVITLAGQIVKWKARSTHV